MSPDSEEQHSKNMRNFELGQLFVPAQIEMALGVFPNPKRLETTLELVPSHELVHNLYIQVNSLIAAVAEKGERIEELESHHTLQSISQDVGIVATETTLVRSNSMPQVGLMEMSENSLVLMRAKSEGGLPLSRLEYINHIAEEGRSHLIEGTRETPIFAAILEKQSKAKISYAQEALEFNEVDTSSSLKTEVLSTFNI
jgi:hypothetical protein